MTIMIDSFLPFRLSNCSVTGEGYATLALALKSKLSHLVELDLRGNNPGDSAVEQLIDFYNLLNHPDIKLQTLRLEILTGLKVKTAFSL